MAPINNKLLRNLSGSECASYFRQLRQNGVPEATITDHLLDAVQCQSVPPVPLMSVWLSFTQSAVTVKTALNQHFSRRTRKFALKAFGRLLGRPHWRLLWSEFGGIDGIMDQFSQLSVSEIGLITSVIGHQIKAGKDVDRDAAISDLLRALVNTASVDAIAHPDPDRRHLVGKYLEILPACEMLLVESMLCRLVVGVPDHPWKLKHFRCHSALIARLTLESALESGHLPDETFDSCLTFCLKNMQQGFIIEPGCSMSMSFAVDLLRRLTREERSNLSDQKFIDDLLEPLLRQCWRRRKLISLSKLEETADFSTSYMHRHSKSFRPSSNSIHSLLYWVVRLWSLSPDSLDEWLCSMLKLLNARKSVKEVTDIAILFVRQVDVDLRYSLLRKIFMNVSDPSADISSVQELSTLNNIWDHKLFLMLTRDEALPLLERLRQAKPDLELSLPYGTRNGVQIGDTITLCQVTRESAKADTDLLYHILRRGQEGALSSVHGFLVRQKKKAMTSRVQMDRAFFARSSLYAAVASGSLGLLNDTMIWLRRYIRDPLTVKALFDEKTFQMSELIDLLAAVPEYPSKQDLRLEVAKAISEANEVMENVYEAVQEALREPSFHASDWRGPLSLFRLVVEKRFDRVKLLQRVIRLSDEQLYDTVWKDTIRMVTNIERSAVMVDNADWQFDKPSGPLCYLGTGRINPKKATAASYRFIDELARARDGLWRDVRRLKAPAVSVLPDPWPRGLTIDHMLLSLDVASPAAKESTPFLTARAKAVVYTPAAAALAELPNHDEIDGAIDTFIENYGTALKIYVLQEHSPNARDLRMQQAWDHAIQAFTRKPMTEDDQIRYLQVAFNQALPGYDLPMSSVDRAKMQLYPVLPEDGNCEDIGEWNPLATMPSSIDGAMVPPRVIDCMLNQSSIWHTYTFETEPITIAQWSANPIWSLQRFKPTRTSRDVREALIISRLLYLDSKIGGKSRLLAQPFPSRQDVRYPPLFLDSEFLLRDDLGHFDLLSFNAHIPVDLVLSLANGAMDQLLLEEDRIRKAEAEDATISGLQSTGETIQHGMPYGPPQRGQYGGMRGRSSRSNSRKMKEKSRQKPSQSRSVELERILFDLIAFLAASDRPQLAADLSLRIILDRPQASSWHRKLLGIKYLQCLPSADVQIFFSNFVNSISDRLAEQEFHKNDTEWKKPYVKITTLKYIAQLLNDVEFISRTDAVNILVKLYKQATHIDVRVAIVESLLGMLSTCNDQGDEPSANTIIEGLRATIPLLGGPSERRQLKEQDWLDAESTGTLPDVSEDSPIVRLFKSAIGMTTWSINLVYRKALMLQIIEPAIEASSLCNERWARLFASKHNAVLKYGDETTGLLAYPINPSIIESLLASHVDMIPARVYQRYRNHTLATLRSNAEFTALIQKIKTSSDLQSSDDSKTFLSLYDKRLSDYTWTHTPPLCLLIGKWTPSQLDHDGITLSMAQKLLLDLVPELLAHYDGEPAHFNRFVSHMQLPFAGDSQRRGAWTENIRPVLEDIVSMIEYARDDLAVDGKPSVLPDTFKFKLWLLDWPIATDDENSRTLTDTYPLAASLILTLEDLTSSHSPLYHTHFLELRDTILQIPSVRQRVQIALQLGDDIEARSSICRSLIQELQERLFLDIGKSKDRAGVLPKVREVARLWIEDQDEEVRRRGFSVRRVCDEVDGGR